MTACSMFLGRSSTFLLTDQVATDDDGMVTALLDKLIVSDRLKIAAVISGRNSMMFDGKLDDPAFDEVSDLFQRASTVDEVRAGLPDAIRRAWQQIEGWKHRLPIVLQGYFALWSGRPDAWIIGGPDHRFAGLEPYTVAPIDAVAQPPVDRALWPPQGRDLTPRIACKLIEQQRRTPSDWGAFTVGGAAELVTVDATGIHRQIIRRWPDRVGRKIDPRPWWKQMI